MIDLFKWFFLESAFALASVLFLINFWMLVRWRRGKPVRPLLIWLVISAALLAGQELIETPREHVEHVLTRVENDLKRGSGDALIANLADDFHCTHLGRVDFAAAVRERLRTLKVNAATHDSPRITSPQKNELVVNFTSTASISAPEHTGPIRTRWVIIFEQQTGGWKITRIDPPWVEGIGQLSSIEGLR